VYAINIPPEYRRIYDLIKYKLPGKQRAFLVEDNVQSDGLKGTKSNSVRANKIEWK